MTRRLLVALLPALLTACTPAAMEGLGRGLAQGASGSTPQMVGLTCRGQSAGTLTRADAELLLNVSDEGVADGTFTNNRVQFGAVGTAVVRANPATGSFYVTQVTLNLDSSTAGQAGARAQLGTARTGAAFNLGYGSTGSFSATITSLGALTGTFRGVQGTYRVTMTCTTG